MITININKKKYTCEEGRTILQTARELGIFIPTLCHFEGLTSHASCQLCLVEVEGRPAPVPACSTRIRPGMIIRTNSEELEKLRKDRLELILSRHAPDCHHCLRIGSCTATSLSSRICEMCFWCDCERDGFCELQKLADLYHIDLLSYALQAPDDPVDDSTDVIIRNPNRCIKCRRCVDVCGKIQTVYNLKLVGKGLEGRIVASSYEKVQEKPLEFADEEPVSVGIPLADSSCLGCGRCVDFCPTGALYIKEHKDEILYQAHAYETSTLALLSADVVPELARLYGLPDQELTTGKVAAALGKIGIDKIYEETALQKASMAKAAALIEAYADQTKSKAGQPENTGTDPSPLILTDSQAVMGFVNRFFPERLDQIHYYENAQALFGRMFSQVKIHVSNRKELACQAKEKGDVDYVINARELYRIFLRTGGAPAKRKEMTLRSFSQEQTGNLYPQITGEKNFSLSGQPEEFLLEVGGKEYKCCVAANLGQVRKLLQGSCQDYQIIRLMA